MESDPLKMPVLSGNQKSMRMYIRKPTERKKSIKQHNRRNSMAGPTRRKNSRRKTNLSHSRQSSLSSKSDLRNGSLDLAPKVRQNKKMKGSGMLNFESIDEDYYELEKITSFLKTSLKSKNLKEFIKTNQSVFDNFIDRIDSGKWMGIDLRSMHGFFIKCFKIFNLKGVK